jgi:hypothetical protein
LEFNAAKLSLAKTVELCEFTTTITYLSSQHQLMRGTLYADAVLCSFGLLLGEVEILSSSES